MLKAAGVFAAVLAVACSRADPGATGVRATATARGIDVSWDAVAGARSFRVQLADLDSGNPVGDPVTVEETHTTLPGAYSRSLGVWVDALPGERAYGFVSAGGGNGSEWQMFGPQDFRGGELRAHFDALGGSERLGVLLINASGPDHASASVQVDGVAADVSSAGAPRTSLMQVAAPGGADGIGVHELVRRAQEPAPVQAALPEPAPQRRSFCIVPGLDFSVHRRKPASLALATAHAEIWVDDEDASHYPATFLPQLAQLFEDRVFGTVTSVFGMPTDVDRNGKMLVVLSHELGTHLNGGWLIGYFGNGDLSRARDDSTDCGSGGSNHGEIIYLNDVANGEANGWSADELVSWVYPETLAHEMQHMLNFGHRCVEKPCDRREETWIDEALSKVAEDLVGFGWNASPGRAAGTAYMSHGTATVRGYDGRSLTRWEGDPIGNYQGAHSFLRFFADRFGAGLAGNVALGHGGVYGLESALGRPLPRAMAEWATALLLSNEPGAAYSFSGAAWSPLHERLRHLDTLPPGKVTLRTDGIAAVTSGAGLGGAAQVTVRSAEGLPPHVVVVRYAAQVPPR